MNYKPDQFSYDKAICQNGYCFNYFYRKFPRLGMEKCKNKLFVGLQIKPFMKDQIRIKL